MEEVSQKVDLATVYSSCVNISTVSGRYTCMLLAFFVYSLDLIWGSNLFRTMKTTKVN